MISVPSVSNAAAAAKYPDGWASRLPYVRLVKQPGESLMNGLEIHCSRSLAIPTDGWLVPSDAPGFGIDLSREQIDAAVA